MIKLHDRNLLLPFVRSVFSFHLIKVFVLFSLYKYLLFEIAKRKFLMYGRLLARTGMWKHYPPGPVPVLTHLKGWMWMFGFGCSNNNLELLFSLEILLLLAYTFL